MSSTDLPLTGLASWSYGPPDVPLDRGEPMDLEALNAEALQRLAARRRRGQTVGPIIVVPGYTPLDAKRPVVLHPTAQRRLELAMEARVRHKAQLILVSGGNVHPEGTPVNEAAEMRRALRNMALHEKYILAEPFARHSTTNLRNAGRLVLAAGLEDCLVVTTSGQGFYLGYPDLSTFTLRCRHELGYELGSIETVNTFSLTLLRFRPDPKVRTRGSDPLDP